MSKQQKEKKQKVYPETLQPQFNVQIPVEVLLHNELDAYAVLVFGYMKLRFQFFQNKGKPYCESNTTISSATGLSRSKVIESINKLESLGFVVRELRNRVGVSKTEQTNIYTVVDCLAKDTPVFKPKTEVKKTAPRVADYSQHLDHDSDPF